MNKSLLLLISLTTTILCITHAYKSSATYNTIKSYYNAQQFDKVYDLQGTNLDSPDKSDKQNLIAELQDLYNIHGPIAYELNFDSKQKNSDESEESDESFQTVAFNKTLMIGKIYWVFYDEAVQGVEFPSSDEVSSLELFDNEAIQSSLSIQFDGLDTLGVREQSQQDIGQLNYILIALEFARQVDAKLIDPTTIVKYNDLKKFHIPYYDPNFTYFFDNFGYDYQEKRSTLSLQKIAIGMIEYQSPAMAEYLQTILQLSNIDKTIKQLGLKQNNSVYAASFPLAFSNYQGLTAKDYAISVCGFTPSLQIIAHSWIHNTLMARNHTSWTILKDANSFLKQRLVRSAMSKWTIKASPQDYASLLSNINNSSMISSKIADLFYEILNPIKAKNIFDKTMFVKDASVIQLWNKKILNIVGSSQLLVPVNGVSQITYALFIQGVNLNQDQSDQLNLLNQFILSDPSFCKDYASRIKQ